MILIIIYLTICVVFNCLGIALGTFRFFGLAEFRAHVAEWNDTDRTTEDRWGVDEKFFVLFGAFFQAKIPWNSSLFLEEGAEDVEGLGEQHWVAFGVVPCGGAMGTAIFGSAHVVMRFGVALK